MKKNFESRSFEKTKEIGKNFLSQISGGEIICLKGDLGSGKTTFCQGFLSGLGAEGPYTSPTFLVMKHYVILKSKKGIKNVYHIDAYRVGSQDLLNLGWEEIISKKENVVIMEWPDRVKEVIPERAIWVNFSWKGEGVRRIEIRNF